MPRGEQFNDYWKKIFSLVSHLNGQGRKVFWQEALQIIHKFPILGAGLNTYTKIIEQSKMQWVAYPHNCYLQMAAEIGTVGLLAFVWILFRLFFSVIANLPNVSDRFLNTVLVGFSAGLFGFLSHSFVDTNFYSVQLGNLLWVVMAVIMAIPRLDK